MNIKILQAENSIENVDRSVISALYNAHINGDISLEVDNNNQKVGLVGSITAPAGYAILVSTLNSAYPKFHVTVNSEYISFEDANVELILLNIGLGDGVGITVLSASNAAFTNSTFKNNTTITSFNEFPYFTRANTNPPVELFRGCSNLEEIDLRLVSTLSASMFYEASKLNNITVGSVLEIPNRCFYRCSSLISFDIPQSCSTIGPLAFRECTNLLNIYGLRNVQYFGAEALNACSNLLIDASDLQNAISIGSTFAAVGAIYGNINMPKLISIDNSAFNRTGGILKVLCLGKVSSIPNQCFFITNSLSNKVLQEVYLPKECTSIGYLAFAESNTLLTTIKQYNLSVDDPNWVVGENYGDITRVTSFGNECFKNCSNLNIPASALLNATSIGTRAFLGCSGITGILNCPNLTSIGFLAILGTNISSITNLGSVNTLTESTLTCSSLTSVTLPSTLRTVSWGFCNNNNNIEKIIFPEGVTDIINLQPVYRNMKYIEVPSTVTSMGACFYRALEHNTANSCFMVIKATTPPDMIFYSRGETISSNGYNLNAFAGIYVPDAALSTYQDTTNLTDDQIGWKVAAVQSKLKRISLLREDNPIWWAEYLTRAV